MPGDVRIDRDDWGMPHVTAATEADAFYGVGWAQAQDQAELMMRYYAMVRGELAALTGDPADVAKDVMSRRWRHAAACRSTYDEARSEVRAAAEAFVEGVADFLAEHPDRAAGARVDLEPYLAVSVHRLALGPYHHLDALSAGLRAGLPVDPEVSELVDLLAERRRSIGASNEWVLRPSRTSFGGAMLLSDPHGSLDGLPMSEVAVHAGDLHYVGFHLIGSALPMLGHTERLAWGCTTGAPLVSDWYVVDTVPGDDDHYLVDGVAHPVERERVEITVKGVAEPVVRELRGTRHNGVWCPVVAAEPGRVHVISSAYMDVPHLLEDQAYAHLRAAGVDDVWEAMASPGWFPQNLLYADADGRLLYVRNGRTPVRRPGVDPSVPLDGNTSATSWDGIHPVADLVHLRDPECGYAQNNNVSPDRMLADTAGTTLDAARYPVYVFGDRPGRTNSRGRRGVELLSAAEGVTVEDGIALATDDLWPGTQVWRDALAASLVLLPSRRATLSPPEEDVLQQLLHFDGRSRAGSSAALAYWYWRSTLPSLPGCDDLLLDELDEGKPVDEQVADLLLRGVEAATVQLLERHGSVRTELGEVFRIGRSGTSLPSRCATIPARKDPDPAYPFDSLVMSLQLMIHREPDADGVRWAETGSHTQRLTVFTRPVRSYALLNYGQSGVVGSPHHVDQAGLFSEGRLRPTYFAPGDLDGHIESTTTLLRKETV